MFLKILAYIVLGLPLIAITLHTIVRVIRYFYKFPMPEFMANAIDNPWRRKIQPPSEMPLRHGITPGMRVLEVGPGNGRYTVATAGHVGPTGKVVTIDIEPKMIERVEERAKALEIENMEAKVGNVHKLSFESGFFDAVYLITVIGEIPDPVHAMEEFHRVLSPSGILAFSEFLTDPDYPLRKTLIRQASQAGFQLKNRSGSFFAYTLVFEKE